MQPHLPQVYLVKRKIGENSYEYFLHALTWFETTAYQAVETTFSGVLGPDGEYHLQLDVVIGDGPELSLMSPVTHTLSLGDIASNGSIGHDINVTVMHDGRVVGTAVVNDDDTVEDEKPIIG